MRDGDRERAREGERERKNLDKYIILLWIERERVRMAIRSPMYWVCCPMHIYTQKLQVADDCILI